MKSNLTEQRILAGIERRTRLEMPVESLDESTEAKVPKAIRTALLTHVEETLNAKGEKYGIKVSLDGSSHGIRVVAWLRAPINATEDEAREVAQIFLGSGFKLVPHSLKKDMWVAQATYQLADIFA